MSNIEVIEAQNPLQEEQAEPIMILDTEQEELGKFQNSGFLDVLLII